MDNQTTVLQLNGTPNPSPVIKRPDHTTPNKMIYARSPSPAHSSNGAQLKPNQVSTVLLYGIPIVSLYIEAQERLCLAQISNTLLKQFSYNEIHNRRVALGITCVQCTPVQLEILRRAGAMPVSSRRCGMITRREAERLCKSFLGDNSPPRLPDDFSFGVLHECAWGCRGAFLPSRYNSSRAKCIKCTFCGLFFSPNKFIFHSHRLGPNDKYVQPDAANFNSWRRHLKLSGNPPDDVSHAWEDVKAMFNGGTRKRMLSSPISMHRRGANGPDREPRENRDTEEVINSPPKRQKEVAPVVPKTPAHFPIRPINIHPTTTSTQQASTPTPVTPPNLANLALRVPAPAATAFPQDLPFTLSRSFMIDYMWHQHHQQQQTISSTTSNPPAKPNQFQFPPYSALSWINKPPSSFLFKPNGSGVNSSDDKPTFNHFSAFKPVVNMRLEPLENSSVNVLNNPNTQSPASSTSSYNHTTTSSTNHSDEELTPIKVVPKKRSVHRLNVDEITSDHSVPTGADTIDVDSNCSGSNIKEHLTTDDENEMVDIETTEDDVHIHNLQPFKYSEDREVDEKCLDIENNNLTDDISEANKLGKKHRASELIKSVQDEEYNAKQARRSPNYTNNNSADWSINLKKEVYFNPPYFNPFKSNSDARL